MPLAALDPFGCIETYLPAMAIGFHALAIEDGGSGAGSLALTPTQFITQLLVDGLPGLIECPLAKDMIDGLPGREVDGQEAPLNTTFDDIEYGVDYETPVRGRSPAFAWFRK